MLTPGGNLSSPAAILDTASATPITGFQSTQQTGNGTQQTLAHGLGVVPSKVIVEVDSLPIFDPTAATTLITQGTHTSTNVLITALSGLKYRVLALP